MITIWALLVTIHHSESLRASGLASFQQEFKTIEECRNGTKLIHKTFDAKYTNIKSLCMGVRK